MITRTNVQTVVYEYAASTDAAAATPGAAAAAAPANVIALSAQDGLALQLSNSSYKYLMDTVNGNLTYCHSTFEAGAIHINPPPALHTEFQPNLKFGPGTGQMPSFGLTLSSSTVQVSYQITVDVLLAAWLDYCPQTACCSSCNAVQSKQLGRNHHYHTVTDSNSSIILATGCQNRHHQQHKPSYCGVKTLKHCSISMTKPISCGPAFRVHYGLTNDGGRPALSIHHHSKLVTVHL